MTEAEAVRLLRFALASVWTECEKDVPNTEDLQRVASEALELTRDYATKGKDLTNDGTGLDGWLQFLGKRTNG